MQFSATSLYLVEQRARVSSGRQRFLGSRRQFVHVAWNWLVELQHVVDTFEPIGKYSSVVKGKLATFTWLPLLFHAYWISGTQRTKFWNRYGRSTLRDVNSSQLNIPGNVIIDNGRCCKLYYYQSELEITFEKDYGHEWCIE